MHSGLSKLAFSFGETLELVMQLVRLDCASIAPRLRKARLTTGEVYIDWYLTRSASCGRQNVQSDALGDFWMIFL